MLYGIYGWRAQMGVLETLNDAITSDTGVKVRNAAVAGLSSIEGGKPEDLYQGPDGKFNPEVFKRALMRTAATSPQAGALYEKVLNAQVQGVPVGGMLTQAIRAPKITYKINKKSDLGSIALDSAKDYYDERAFQAARAQALSGMSQAVNELTMKQQQANAKATGYYAAEAALRTTGKVPVMRSQKYDMDKLIELADKEYFAETGRRLTDDEKQYAWDALKKGYKRGFAKKGLNLVYQHLPGGLEGQRYRAAHDTVSRNRIQTAQRGQMIGEALGKAYEKTNQVAAMQKRSKRVTGPHVNIGKLMDTYKQLEAQEQMMKGGGVKTGSADNPTLLNALSREDFETRPAGITRLIYRRNFDEVGGARRYADSLAHDDFKDDGITTGEKLSLKAGLSKYLRERSFMDDPLFEISDEI